MISFKVAKTDDESENYDDHDDTSIFQIERSYHDRRGTDIDEKKHKHPI